MKMKKLLSMGALTLAVVCSTAVGASAAERPSNAEIKKDMKQMFLEGKNPLNYNFNSNNTINSVANNKEIINEVAQKFAHYHNIVKALKLIETNKTVKENSVTIVETLTESELNGLVAEARSIAVKLRDIENAQDSTRKIEIENEIKNLIELADGNVQVYFGKNIDGKITMSIMNNNKIILQLNSGNAYTISNSLKGDNISNLIRDAKNILG